MLQIPEDPIRYRHFILSIWQERNSQGRHLFWRFSLQDSQKEVRIGFKSLMELTAYLEQWLNASSENDPT
jgi:hypothetical protein